MDIIRNVNKQRQEIDKILGDIRDARKDVNTGTSKLERSFAAADETVFKDAKAKPELGGSAPGSRPTKGVTPYDLPKCDVVAIDERDQGCAIPQ